MLSATLDTSPKLILSGVGNISVSNFVDIPAPNCSSIEPVFFILVTNRLGTRYKLIK